MKLILSIATALLVAGCTSKKPFHEVKTDNPDFYANTTFKSYEDLTSPGFQALKEKYQLDTIFHGETDELKRILLLRNWIRSVIKINDPGPPRPVGTLFFLRAASGVSVTRISFLDAIRHGR